MRQTNKALKRLEELKNDVINNWPFHKGKNEFIKFLSGEEITRKESGLAMCYTCMYGYDGGPEDCQGYSCPMYNFFPYRTKASRKEYTEEQKAAFVERMKKVREKSEDNK